MRTPSTPDRNWSQVCDCGRAKSNNDVACSRCSFLDGQNSSSARLIAALRNCREMTVGEIAAEVGENYQSVARTLARMAKRGRVAVRKIEAAGNGYGASGVLVYALAAREEREWERPEVEVPTRARRTA